MYMKYYLALLPLFLTISLSAYDLDRSADSLETVLKKTTSLSSRVEILNNLFDIDLAKGRRTHLSALWDAACELKDVYTLDDLALPMALSYQTQGKQDSVDVWMQRARENIGKPFIDNETEYLKLMKDIRQTTDYVALGKQLISEKVNLDPRDKPFEAMRILYTLGVMTDFLKQNNNITDVSSEEYYKEALKIARKLDFRQGLRFYRQVLLALTGTDVQYAKEYLELTKKFYSEPDIAKRPFYSRRGLLLAYDRLILNGKSIPRAELDGYFLDILKVENEFPNDTPTPFRHFNARVHYRYYSAVSDEGNALRWCDSLITQSAKYKLGPEYYYSDRKSILAAMGRWQEAYKMSEMSAAFKDSMANVSHEKQLTELQTQYQVDTLKKEKHSKSVQLALAMTASLILVLTLVLIVIYSEKLRNKNRILLRQLSDFAGELKKAKSEENGNVLMKSIEQRGQETNPAEASDQSNVKEVIRKEKLYLNPDFSRDSLEEKFGLNNNKIAEIFSNDNAGFTDYVAELRLEEALLLIENYPDMSFTEVSEKAGFSVYSTFYRSFVKRYGVKPSYYRKYLSDSRQSA